MCNQDIREAIKKAGVRYWQVATKCNISDTTFTRRLRHELPDEEKAKIFEAIKLLSEKEAR